MAPRTVSKQIAEPSKAPSGAGTSENGIAERDLADTGNTTPGPARMPNRSPLEGYTPNALAGLEAMLEAHAGNWGQLDARAAAAARGEATLTHGETVMLSRRDERQRLGQRGRPKGGSLKTSQRNVEISQHLARRQRDGLRREDAIEDTMKAFRASRKTVEAAEPIFKEYGRDEQWIAEIDPDALARGEVPDVSTRKAKPRKDTEADHLAALHRMLRKHLG